MRKFALAALAGALALSACGKKEEEAPLVNNLVEPPIENVIIEEPEAPSAPGNNVAAPEPAPPPAISEQQQIQDDAEATGMTARLDSGDDGASNASD